MLRIQARSGQNCGPMTTRRSSPPGFVSGRSPIACRSIPWVFRNTPERTSHERHDRPATQHPEEVDGDGQNGDRSRELPGPEIDRDLVRVLNGEDTDRSEEGQEDDGLNESHSGPLVLDN